MNAPSALHLSSVRSAGRRWASSLLALLALCAIALPVLAQPDSAEVARAQDGGTDPAKTASVVEMARFLPLRPGNRWSFVGDYGTEQTVTAENRVSLSGVSVVPLTTTLQGVPAGTVYFTNDRDGLQRYRETIDTVYIDGYGAVSASATFSPPILHAPAFATVGSA